jgi:hypothetical protein
MVMLDTLGQIRLGLVEHRCRPRHCRSRHEARNNPLPYRLHLRIGARYMLIESGWYITVSGDTGGPGARITRSISEIHLPQLIEYARLRNIGVWVGVDRKPLDAQMDKAPLWPELGPPSAGRQVSGARLAGAPIVTGLRTALCQRLLNSTWSCV